MFLMVSIASAQHPGLHLGECKGKNAGRHLGKYKDVQGGNEGEHCNEQEVKGKAKGKKDKEEMFTIIQITDNTYSDMEPDINNRGDVVWASRISLKRHNILRYDGAGITHITHDDDWHLTNHRPEINDNGIIAFNTSAISNPGAGTSWAKVYDGNTIKIIGKYVNGSRYPQINNRDEVVFEKWDNDNPVYANYEIFLYDGESVKKISDSFCPDYRPEINHNGHVTWFASTDQDENQPRSSGCSMRLWEIFLFDGEKVVQVTNNQFAEMHSDINIAGDMIWTSGSYELYHYKGSTKTIERMSAKIDTPSDTTHPFDTPQINSKGNIIWISQKEIYLYNGSTITQITESGNTKRQIGMNDNDYVVWQEWDGSFWQIMVYDGTIVHQITSTVYDNYFPGINNRNEIVYQGGNNDDAEIFLVKMR